jgi:hypothetical protein
MVSSKGLQPLRSATRSLGALPAACNGAQVASRRYAGTLAAFKIPNINNEPNVSQSSWRFELRDTYLQFPIATLQQRFCRPKEASRCGRSSEAEGLCPSTSRSCWRTCMCTVIMKSIRADNSRSTTPRSSHSTTPHHTPTLSPNTRMPAQQMSRRQSTQLWRRNQHGNHCPLLSALRFS